MIIATSIKNYFLWIIIVYLLFIIHLLMKPIIIIISKVIGNGKRIQDINNTTNRHCSIIADLGISIP